MKELYELKDKLMKELEKYSSKDAMTAGTLEVVDKLAHTIKNLCKIIDDMEEYSGARGREYSRDTMYGSYAKRDSMGRYSRHGSFVEELRKLMREAPDEHTRSEIEMMVKNMER